MDSFLEREKELMKLNETLNQKCAITLAAKTKLSKASKVKKSTPMKTIKNVKSKLDGIEINSIALADGNKHSNDTKVATDSVGNDNGNGNEANEAMTHELKVDNGTETDTTNALDNRDPIERFLNDFTVESKLNLTNDSPAAATAKENAKPTNGVSLIPNNMVRRNVSTDGIIKWVIGIQFCDSSIYKSNAVCRFLKAKVTILQQELELSHKDNAKHLDQLAKIGEQQKKIEAVRDQSSNKVNNLKTQIEKMQQQIAEAELKSKVHSFCQTFYWFPWPKLSEFLLQEKDTELQSLRKECTELKSKLKQTNQSNSALESRLFKSQEDLEYVRKNYQAAKAAEKELQTTLQQERKFYENRLKSERKEYNDLIAAYKKQMLLVDNLKRQNTLLQQSKLIQIIEQDFMRCLDWPNGDSTEKQT